MSDLALFTHRWITQAITKAQHDSIMLHVYYHDAIIKHYYNHNPNVNKDSKCGLRNAARGLHVRFNVC